MLPALLAEAVPAAPLSLGEAALFGAVQGLTEFLPVSSSGHLALLGHWLKMGGERWLFLTVWVHGATLAAVMGYYWRDMAGFLGLLFPPARRWGWNNNHNRDNGEPAPLEGWPLAGRLILATLPATLAVVLGAEDAVESLSEQPRIVGALLMVTGLIVLATLGRWREKSPIGWGRAFLIGCAQMLALAPGISRSGTTIVAGLMLGVPRREAARFSFLMSMPAIGGGLLLEVLKGVPSELSMTVLLASGLAAFGSGLLAIWLVMRFIERGFFWVFGGYCLLMGGCAWALMPSL
jgi:undecaprenyl-diphosphatase